MEYSGKATKSFLEVARMNELVISECRRKILGVYKG
jgi:hypothetical protein